MEFVTGLFFIAGVLLYIFFDEEKTENGSKCIIRVLGGDCPLFFWEKGG